MELCRWSIRSTGRKQGREPTLQNPGPHLIPNPLIPFPARAPPPQWVSRFATGAEVSPTGVQWEAVGVHPRESSD